MSALSRWLARLAALTLGVGLVAGVELGLRAFGVGGDALHDPRAGFSRHAKAFRAETLPDGTAVWRLDQPGARTDVSRFLADKPEGGFRVFVVGGSSAAGVPYTYDVSFAAWLAQRLAAELPDVPVEVVNASASGFATHRLRVRVGEIARHAPDLLVVYAGHNERAERLYYGDLVGMHPALFRLWELAASTRLYRLVEGAVRQEPLSVTRGRRADDPRQMFSVEAPAPTAAERAELERAYRSNLEAMIREMHRVGARVLLLTLSQNFADWAPGRSIHREDLSEEARRAWERDVAEGRSLAARDCTAALAAWTRALALDADHAGLHYEMGSCQRRLGRIAEARESFVRASDLDAAVMGAPSRYDAVIRELARTHDTLLVEVGAALEREDALVGDALFADFVHPNLRGHLLIADAIAEALRLAGLPVPAERWRVGAWTPPDADALYVARPDLRLREHATRLLVCELAGRDCRFDEARALLKLDPDNAVAREVLAKRARTAPDLR